MVATAHFAGGVQKHCSTCFEVRTRLAPNVDWAFNVFVANKCVFGLDFNGRSPLRLHTPSEANRCDDLSLHPPIDT